MPVTVVDALTVPGRSTHVLPPSMLYCHSYAVRGPAERVTIFAEPETAP